MKNFVKLLSIMGMAGCLLFGKVDVQAADQGFIELPMEEVQIIISSEDEGVGASSVAAASLGGCELGIGIASNGVSITFSTSSTQVASEIGVKNIVLQEKNGLGWTNIGISNHYDRNRQEYTGGVVYTGAQRRKTYRVYCTHYAIINGREYTLYSITDNLVYN